MVDRTICRDNFVPVAHRTNAFRHNLCRSEFGDPSNTLFGWGLFQSRNSHAPNRQSTGDSLATQKLREN